MEVETIIQVNKLIFFLYQKTKLNEEKKHTGRIEVPKAKLTGEEKH